VDEAAERDQTEPEGRVGALRCPLEDGRPEADAEPLDPDPAPPRHDVVAGFMNDDQEAQRRDYNDDPHRARYCRGLVCSRQSPYKAHLTQKVSVGNSATACTHLGNRYLGNGIDMYKDEIAELV
jgi:hypothetical protein